MEQVSPTRTELLVRRAQIDLARQGAELLRGKREALIREFLAELEAFVAQRARTHDALAEGVRLLGKCLAIDGPEQVASASLACRQEVAVTLDEENIWGTKVVTVGSEYVPRASSDRGYSPGGVSTRIDETATQFERVVDLVIRMSPIDRKLRTLAAEIRKTNS